MLRELLYALLLVAALAAALIVEAVWGYALAAIIAIVVLSVFWTGGVGVPEDRRE